MTNPYESPANDAASVPAKPYTRFWLIVDLLCLLFAAGPAAVELVEVVVIMSYQRIKFDVDTTPFVSLIIFVVVMLSILLLWGISFLVNIVGSIKGRRMSIAGVIANIVSLVCIIIPGP